jgi:biotin carboxylase
MKQVLEAADLPVPRFGRFSTFEDLETLVSGFRFPIVIKPIELAGSVGVLKVETPADLRPTFDHCISEVEKLGGVYRTREDLFQVEEYVPALSEVSIEVINAGDLHRVLAVTEKYLGSEPYFVEVGHMVPSPHTDNARLRQVAEDACRALGITMGIAHVEARITPEGDIRIMEVGARTGGDAIMDLVERVYGINPYQLYVESFMGRALSLPAKLEPRGTSAVAFLKAPEGVIEKVALTKELPAELVNIQVWTKPKDRSLPPTSWRAREGSAEFFWPGLLTTAHGWSKHLELAQEISAKSFEVQS